MNGYTRPTYAEIDLEAVKHNIHCIKEKVGPGVRIMPAVKADAYGHGSVPVSRAVVQAGADALGVACVEEALELREAGFTVPILILGCSTQDAIPFIVENNIAAAVCDIDFGKKLAEEAKKQGKLAVAHIKVDTGMGRIGVKPDGTRDLVAGLMSLGDIFVEGIFTHFPTSDAVDKDFTSQQILIFRRLINDLEVQGMYIPLRHTANSGAILDHADACFNLVRPGIITYGYFPSDECSRDLPIRPALSLKTSIVFLKEIQPGTTVSYGRTFRASRPTKVATLPIGYADGYNRQLSNRGKAWIKEQVVPVIGRVCMDQIMIDVTDVPGAGLGDIVTLYGPDDVSISVEETARLLNTIPYEVTCWISKRVPRVYK